MNAVATRIASSSEIGGFGVMNVTSCLIMPMLPIGRITVNANSGSHFPVGPLRKYENT